ncbi:MAG: hypothetical protein IPI90_04740 [Saprospiraceae bacterium]|nr:hypothetical protein [Candidatus Vicinibacter affinis]
MSATHIRMMHKALEQMNIKIQHVIADITGKSGQEIIKSIIAGERNAEILASCCDSRIRAHKRGYYKILKGVWKEEHVFELEQSYSIYQFYHAKLKECDAKIEEHLREKSGVDTFVEPQKEKE